MSEKKLSITAEQLNFLENGYFETFSLAWLEHALKVILFSTTHSEEKQTSALNLCLFNAIYVSCNQLPNYPLGRYRSAFYKLYLSHTSFMNDLTLSVNSSTVHQLETCLKSFLEHQCNNNNDLCDKFRQLGKQILLEQQQTGVEDVQSLRSIGDRKLNRYREQVFLWLKQIWDSFSMTRQKDSSSKINEHFLQERLIPMTREIFLRELSETKHCKQRQTPDLAILHRLYAESGTKIPLSDWFEVGLEKSKKIIGEVFVFVRHLHR